MFDRLRQLTKELVLNAITPSWWWGIVREAATGNWQRNITVETKEGLLTNPAIFSAVTGIAADIGKLRLKLVEDKDGDGIWEEVTSGAPWLQVLRKPNHYQNRIQFLIQWLLSKLLAGNTYVLKERDARGVVNALYVLDPRRVTPLVADDGAVFYELQIDQLSNITQEQRPDLFADGRIVAPASEIIHDRMPALWHPLVGVSPLYACAMSGTLGNKITNHSATFFDNKALPGGVLSAPGKINTETAERLKKDFEAKFGGENRGRLAVLGDGLKFEAMTMTAEASQLAEQMKMSREDIATAFHYPLFKLGGEMPPYAGNVQAMIIAYYTDCLQVLIESIELCLDEGLELPKDQGTEFDLDNLLRMDTTTLVNVHKELVGAGIEGPDEARFVFNKKSVTGGNTPYLQQQNYSLAALAKRDALPDPFGKAAPATPPPADTPTPQPPPRAHDNEDEADLVGVALRRELLPS
jgi:HK97 family phage portal protein